jgi:hypothetical protein
LRRKDTETGMQKAGAQKKCGPGQTRRLTGTAGALDL